jgi:hypothetical protein
MFSGIGIYVDIQKTEICRKPVETKGRGWNSGYRNIYIPATCGEEAGCHRVGAEGTGRGAGGSAARRCPQCGSRAPAQINLWNTKAERYGAETTAW